MNGIISCDTPLTRLTQAIARRVGSQRFHVWFNNSTRLDLKNDGLEIAVPNDFISEWIGRHFSEPIQDAALEVLGCRLSIRYAVTPELFDGRAGKGAVPKTLAAPPAPAPAPAQIIQRPPAIPADTASPISAPARLRHTLDNFVVGASNQLAFTAANCVADSPGTQYNPLFIHGSCGLGKTHLLQGLTCRFLKNHPSKRWVYLTGEEFTNSFLQSMRQNKLDQFRRRMRDLDLLVIDDVHFLAGKNATQEEFLHTFNAIEALGRQLVIASDSHPKTIAEFGESLINRFVSGMVVRIDPPNHAMRCQILRQIATRHNITLPDDVLNWISQRVTQNVRELEGAVTRVVANVRITGKPAELSMVREALGDLDRQLVSPLKTENILIAVCQYFGLEMSELMSNRRQRTISLARSAAMHLIRRTARLSFPEIGMRLGKRNHSTVISACRRMDRAIEKKETLAWTSSTGERSEEASELLQRLEELSRSLNC